MRNKQPKIVSISQQGKQPLLPAPLSQKSARLLWHRARYRRRAAQLSPQLTEAQDEGCGDSSRVKHATRADFLWRWRPRLTNLAGAVEQSSAGSQEAARDHPSSAQNTLLPQALQCSTSWFNLIWVFSRQAKIQARILLPVESQSKTAGGCDTAGKPG